MILCQVSYDTFFQAYSRPLVIMDNPHISVCLKEVISITYYSYSSMQPSNT